MNTAFRGNLVALGTPTGETQPRALIHCTQQEIQSLKFLALGAVIVVGESELKNTLAELERRLKYIADTLITTPEPKQDVIEKLCHNVGLCVHDVLFLKGEK
jgi:hypothetical protein